MQEDTNTGYSTHNSLPNEYFLRKPFIMNTLEIISQKRHSSEVNSHGLNTLRLTSCRSRLCEAIPAKLMIPIGRHLGGGYPASAQGGSDSVEIKLQPHKMPLFWI